MLFLKVYIYKLTGIFNTCILSILYPDPCLPVLLPKASCYSHSYSFVHAICLLFEITIVRASVYPEFAIIYRDELLLVYFSWASLGPFNLRTGVFDLLWRLLGITFKNTPFRTSLVVQWLGLWVFTAGGTGSIPGQKLRSYKLHGKAKQEIKNTLFSPFFSFCLCADICASEVLFHIFILFSLYTAFWVVSSDLFSRSLTSSSVVSNLLLLKSSIAQQIHIWNSVPWKYTSPNRLCLKVLLVPLFETGKRNLNISW